MRQSEMLQNQQSGRGGGGVVYTEVQMTEFVSAMKQHVDRELNKAELRKWCVEQAIKYFEVTSPGDDGDSPGVIEKARDILQFIGEPFADMFKEAKNEPVAADDDHQRAGEDG